MRVIPTAGFRWQPTLESEFISLLGDATAAWPLAVPQQEMHVLRYLAAAPYGGGYFHGEHRSMENVSTRTTRRPDSLILRKLAELKEREGWAHHVADAATGKLLTTRLASACRAADTGRAAVPARPPIRPIDLRDADIPAYAATPVPGFANGFPLFPLGALCVQLTQTSPKAMRSGRWRTLSAKRSE